MFRLTLKEAGYILFVALVIAHFIISLGQTERFFTLLLMPYYWLDLAYVVTFTFIVIGSLYLTHRWLDQVVPIFVHPRKRIFHQVLYVIIIPSIVTLILAWIYQSLILGYSFTHTSFLQYEFPAAVLIIIICSLGLMVITIFKSKMGVRQETSPPMPVFKDVLIVQQGNKKVSVETSDIAAIYKEGDLPVVFTFSGKQYVLNESLENIIDSLDPRLFFRANRQAIVHLRLCEHYEVNRSGKIDLKLGLPLARMISVSQKKGREFKNWITQS